MRLPCTCCSARVASRVSLLYGGGASMSTRPKCVRKLSAVRWPTAASLRVGGTPCSTTSAAAWSTALLLTNSAMSNSSSRASSARTGAASSTGAISSTGKASASPPAARISSHSRAAWCAGRVTMTVSPCRAVLMSMKSRGGGCVVELSVTLICIAQAAISRASAAAGVDRFQDCGRTLREQFIGECDAEAFGIAARTAALAADHLAAVGRTHEAAEMQRLAVERRVTRDGHLAAAFEAVIHRALRRDAGEGVGVIAAAFDADRALTDRRQAHARVEIGGDAPLEAEALQTRGGEDHGVEIAGIELGEARIDVAAQAQNRVIGPPSHDLALTA